jgi:hypothetical protein
MLVLIGLPIALFPLALYLLALSVVNGRPRPTLVSGSWDFVGALLGLAGFILFGGPMLVAEVVDHWRASALRGKAWLSFEYASLLWPAYAALLIGGAALVLRRRRRTTVVYNVRPGELTRALGDVFGRLGDFWARGTEYHFTPAGVPPGDGAKAQPVPRSRVVVEVVPFEGMRNATLVWTAEDPGQRRAVETELRRELAAAAARDPEAGGGPAAAWFLTAAGVLTIIACFALGVLVYLVMLSGRRG